MLYPKTSDSLIIGYDFTNGEDNTVLVIGRKKPTEQVEIINAFQGKEAIEMYHKLVTPKGEKS